METRYASYTDVRNETLDEVRDPRPGDRYVRRNNVSGFSPPRTSSVPVLIFIEKLKIGPAKYWIMRNGAGEYSLERPSSVSAERENMPSVVIG